jgi:hypothetical protein
LSYYYAGLRHARRKETTHRNQKQELPTTGQTRKAHGIGIEPGALASRADYHRLGWLVWKSLRVEKSQKALPPQIRAWVEARKRHRLSHAQVQMARELGLNPGKLGKLSNHRQEP